MKIGETLPFGSRTLIWLPVGGCKLPLMTPKEALKSNSKFVFRNSATATTTAVNRFSSSSGYGYEYGHKATRILSAKFGTF